MNEQTYYNTCKDCGANLDPGERCDCQNQNATIFSITKRCKTCNNLFTISKNEIEWLQRRKLGIFENCGPCRKLRKIEKSLAELKGRNEQK